MGKNRELKRLAAEAEASNGEHGTASERPSKKARTDNSRSLFVRSLAPHTTTETLTNFFSQHFPVKHATVVVDPGTKKSRGYGFVTFTDVEDTQAAKEQLQGQKIDGRPISLDIAESRHRQPGAGAQDAATKKEDRRAALAEARKAPKLIIRNLPWSIKHSDQLAALFRPYGLVKYADVPQHKGKLSGFGFVTMRGRKNAQAAIDGVNEKIIDGRILSVDWAVSKDEWQKDQKPDETNPTTPTKPEVVNEDDDISIDEGEEDDVDEQEGKGDEDGNLDEDLKNFMKNHFENLEEEKDSDADEEEEDDDEEANSDEEGENHDDAAPVTSARPQITDNSTTVFVRNLPFTATDEQLKAHFEQFGRVNYARVVHDRATDRPAGTGFVRFATEADFKACLKGAPRAQQSAVTNKKSILQNEMADEAGKYTIDGRILQVTQAVNKDEATRLAQTATAAREGKIQDRRRLYLLAEGAIPKDSPIFRMLSPSEVKIRDQSAAQRKKMIQSNPSLHVSLTRLAVRNMPRNLDSKGLKALAREAVVGFASDVKAGLRQPLSKEENNRGGEEDKEAERRRKQKGKGIVKQAKIMFENKAGSKVPEMDGAGKSRGYGFIEYTSHRWALMGLRWLNGHAVKTEDGKTLRLIVEFAIENQQVVARRRDLQERSRTNQTNNKKEGPAQDEAKKNLPRGKDFSVSKEKGKWQKGKGKGGYEDSDKATSPKMSPSKENLQQKLMIRKRMTRKKKAQARS
jgi:nucleolar protein 4